MKLSTRCRYAALALFDMAYHHRGEPTQVRQIAARQNIPLRFLEQIFQDLKRAELVEGKRGRNGGYSLRRLPSAITLGDVVKATDGPVEVSFTEAEDEEVDGEAPSASGEGRSEVPALIWTEIGRKIGEVFDGYTLSDLVKRAEAAGIPRDAPRYMYFI